MGQNFYSYLAKQSIAGHVLSKAITKELLVSPDIALESLLDSAYMVRKRFWGKKVFVQVLNNAQNGHCSEDCHYCAQSKSSNADIKEYPLKSDQEILDEAHAAHARGAHRYCIVYAGRAPSLERIKHIARLVVQIKSMYSMEVCVSPGILDYDKARILKEAGLDRLNHNLNTSGRHYKNICTTHTYEDRIRTMKVARTAGLELCSGVIVGMGEDAQDVIEVAYALRENEAVSIPINFYMPIAGTVLTSELNSVSDLEAGSGTALSPQYCLRVLCLYRLINPRAEIRIAAGREMHLKELEAKGLYPANSLFVDGYLNTKGDSHSRVFKMITDEGFEVYKSE